MARVDAAFKDRVYALVGQIPAGRVMTYGQVAALCGAPYAAWEVGQIAHYASCTCGSSGRSGLDEAQGSGEKRTEPYIRYSEGASEPLTPRFAKSSSGVDSFAGKQAAAP